MSLLESLTIYSRQRIYLKECVGPSLKYLCVSGNIFGNESSAEDMPLLQSNAFAKLEHLVFYFSEDLTQWLFHQQSSGTQVEKFFQDFCSLSWVKQLKKCEMNATEVLPESCQKIVQDLAWDRLNIFLWDVIIPGFSADSYMSKLHPLFKEVTIESPSNALKTTFSYNEGYIPLGKLGKDKGLLQTTREVDKWIKNFGNTYLGGQEKREVFTAMQV